MPQTADVLVGLPDGDHVLFTNWRRAPEDWTYADVEIRCGPWRGVIKVAFYADELTQFAEGIKTVYKQLNGKAELRPFDCRFAVTLSGNGRGGVTVGGHEPISRRLSTLRIAILFGCSLINGALQV